METIMLNQDRATAAPPQESVCVADKNAPPVIRDMRLEGSARQPRSSCSLNSHWHPRYCSFLSCANQSPFSFESPPPLHFPIVNRSGPYFSDYLKAQHLCPLICLPQALATQRLNSHGRNLWNSYIVRLANPFSQHSGVFCIIL